VPATLERMAKKQSKPAADANKPERKGTAVVRIASDLARKVNIISTATGEDVADILSPMVREQIEARYIKVIRELGQEIEGKEEA
jgi:hypothetical protein